MYIFKYIYLYIYVYMESGDVLMEHPYDNHFDLICTGHSKVHISQCKAIVSLHIPLSERTTQSLRQTRCRTFCSDFLDRNRRGHLHATGKQFIRSISYKVHSSNIIPGSIRFRAVTVLQECRRQTSAPRMSPSVHSSGRRPDDKTTM